MATDQARKADVISVRLELGTLEKVDTLLKGGELRAGFVRKAVINEIIRRSRRPGVQQYLNSVPDVLGKTED